MKPLALIAAAVMLLAGCGNDTTAEPSPSNSFSSQIAQERADAAEQGATASQLAILDEAAAAGEVTMEQVLAARDDFAECLTAGGFELVDAGTDSSNGYPYPQYSVKSPAGSAGTDTTYMDDCYAKTFGSVDFLYQTQPKSQQLQDTQFDNARPQLTACMEGLGITVPDDLDRDEFKSFLLEQLSTNFDNNPSEMPVQDCLSDAGINGF